MIKDLYIRISLLMLLTVAACEKEKSPKDAIDNNTINLVVADNFNLSVFNAALRRSGLYNTLQQQGPFTALAPSDNAFAAAGYPNATSMLTSAAATASLLANYHVLNGRFELNRLPFLFNQELRSRSGGMIYVTHWLKGADTVLTINGAQILTQNIPASNGYIQVIDRVLEPYVNDLVSDAIADDDQTTLFYQALKRSGLLALLDEGGPYTVFAPNNAAMVAYGYTSLAQVNEADPAELATLLRYHIVQDRRFINDYILSTGETNKSSQAMLDGNVVTITLIPNPTVPGAFTGITLQGTGNTAPVNISRQDVLAGNGILQVIDGVLKVNQ